MKICAIPFDIKYASPHENIITVAHALSQVEKDTDLVVLPELFTTSFVNDAKTVEVLAEDNSGNTMENVRRWAQFFGMALCGSFLAKDANGNYCNRAFFVEPAGDTTFYNKRHLFTLSTENQVYTAGAKPMPRIRYRGWDFAMAICFDLRFPVWCRNTASHPYDVFLLPCNWPHSRSAQLRTLAAARAIENQAYCVVCNRLGSDDYGEYLREDSGMWDYLGEHIQETRRNGFIYSYLERKEIDSARRRFPFIKSADGFDLQL